MILINYLFSLNITVKSFLFGFLYLKNLPITNINDHWTTHLWSVSIEMQFYLFFPLLLFVNINKTAVLAATAVIGILIFSLLGFNHTGIFYSNAVLYRFCRIAMDAFWEGPFPILIGSLFSVLAFKGIINGKVKYAGILYFVLLVTAIIIRSRTFWFYTPYLSEFVFDVLIGFTIVMSTGSVNLFTRLMNTRFLAWMGTLSYSIYIWQQIFVWIPMYWVTNNTLFILADVLRLACMIGTACLSYYFFERKFLRLKMHYAVGDPRGKTIKNKLNPGS
jgi:peptidoglycan/LPS O-acetylase OafA/YrhL